MREPTSRELTASKGGASPRWIAPVPREEPEFRSHLRVLGRHKLVLLACVVLFPIAVYLLSSLFTNHYEAKSILQIQAQSIDTSPNQALAAAARIATTPDVAERAAGMLKPPPDTPASLIPKVSVSTDQKASFLTIAARDSSPTQAADIANAFASGLVQERSQRARSQLNASIVELESTLKTIPTGDTRSRGQLSRKLQELRALRAAQYGQVIERAVPPKSPVSPRPLRNAGIALGLGLLAGIGLAFLLDRYVRRIREPLELEELTGTPLLGAIPTAAFSDDLDDSSTSEAFQILNANLVYFNLNRGMGSVVVASPLEGDGKTTVATRLARAAARAGKDVILVDADLRRPQIGPRFGLNPGAGLTSVLAGEKPVEEVLEPVSADGGRLRILTSGAIPANPSGLIGSDRFRSLVADLTASSDLTIIDSPPALAFGDTVPLLQLASGVVIVVRTNSTPADAVDRLAVIVANAGGQLLGTVATGVEAMSGSYGVYSGNNSAGKRRFRRKTRRGAASGTG